MRNALVMLGVLWLKPVAVAPHLETQASPVRVETCTPIAIGMLPLEVDAAGRRVHFAEWTMDQEGGDFVGFAAALPEGIHAEIRVGEQTFTTTRSRWVHPGLKRIDAMSLCGEQVLPAVAAL